LSALPRYNLGAIEPVIFSLRWQNDAGFYLDRSLSSGSFAMLQSAARGSLFARPFLVLNVEDAVAYFVVFRAAGIAMEH
jgi:hypothetical protein